MRWFTAVLSGALCVGCGDPLAPTAWQGALLLEAKGQLNVNEDTGLSLLEKPLRAGLFWSPGGEYDEDLDRWIEQASVPVPPFVPSRFEVRIHTELPAEMQVAGARYGIGRMLIYWDDDGDGRRGLGDPWVGFQDRAGWIFAPHALQADESPTALSLARGYHQVALPLPCNTRPTTPDETDCGVHLGSACVADADCGAGAGCYLMLGQEFNAGICAVALTGQGACVPSNGAAIGYTVGRGNQYLIKACARDADCTRPGYTCDRGAGACMSTGEYGGFRLNPGLLTSIRLPPGEMPAPVCADVQSTSVFQTRGAEGMMRGPPR